MSELPFAAAMSSKRGIESLARKYPRFIEFKLSLMVMQASAS
jgi:hypothetical protein